MSTIHYSTEELVNVYAAIVSHRDSEDYKAHIAEVLHKCSVANTYAAQADGWPESETRATTAEEIRRPRMLAGHLDRAISTLTGMRSNCNGFLGDKVGAQAFGLLSTLSSKMLQVRAEERETLAAAQETIRGLRAELATKPAGKARSARSGR